MVTLLVLESVVLVLVVILLAGLLRSHADILRALQKLGVSLDGESDRVPPPRPLDGISAAAFAIDGVDPDGLPVRIEADGGRPLLLAFLTSGCSTCLHFWDVFRDDVDVPGNAELVVVTKGSEQESPAKVRDLATENITVVMSSPAWSDYAVEVAPYFVMVADGRVTGEGAALQWPQLVSVLGQSLDDDPATRARSRASVDEVLAHAGIHPGHPSLYGEVGETVEP